MNDLVEIMNGQAITTSLKVAEVFDKRHDLVLRDIRNLINEIGGILKNEETPETASVSNALKNEPVKMFYETTYIHKQNKQQYPMYLMNRDGFTLLAMGFTGQKALKFKLDYINAFNTMEEKIKVMAERQSEQWMVARQSTKLTQRKVTDAIKEYVIPNARANDSETPDNVFYMNYNKLFNKAAKVPAGQRDKLSVSNLIMLDQMQSVAAANIRLQAKSGAGYKEIFSVTKNAVEGYAQIAFVAERLLLN